MMRNEKRREMSIKAKRNKILKDRLSHGIDTDMDSKVLKSSEESRIKRIKRYEQKHKSKLLSISKGYMHDVPGQDIFAKCVYRHDDDNKVNRFVIVSACHNKKAYIDDAIESVVYQDYRPVQLVIIDDCSTDGSLRRLIKRAPYLMSNGISYSVIQSPRRLYCSSSYNAAMSVAEGTYFGILDSDDMLNVGAMSKIAKIYEKYTNVAFIWTQHIVCSPTMEKEKIGISKSPPSGVGLLEYGHEHSFSHWRTFSNRINKGGIFCNGLRSAVDKYMGYRMEELGSGMFVNEQCYLYRTSLKNSITGQEQTKKSWEKVMHAAQGRRAKNHSAPFPLVEYEG